MRSPAGPSRPSARRRAADRLPRLAALAAGIALTVGLACDLAVAGPRSVGRRGRSTAAVARIVTRRLVDTARVERHIAAGVALAPVRIAAAGPTIAVLDAAHRRLARWADTVVLTGPRLGPAPTHLAASADAFTVLDPAAGRLTVLDADGHVRRRVGIAHLPMPYAACALGPERWLLLTEAADSALVAVDPSGRVHWASPLPWPQVARWPALARQGVLRASRSGCVLAMAFGPGWAEVLPDGRLPTVMPYRDAVPTPRARRWRGGTRLTAMAPLVADAAVRQDTLDLLVAGTGAGAWRTIDRYAVHTGAYAGSVLLPGPVRAIAAWDRGWVVVVPSPTGPHLARVQRRPHPRS